MLGNFTTYQEASGRPLSSGRQTLFEWFAQDSWKVKPNFTLEYGVRAGYWPNNIELNGLGGWFDPSTYDPRVTAITA